MSHNNAAPVPFRYRKPGYVALAVTDLDCSIAFYRDLVGLTLQERHGDEIAFLRCGKDHHDVVLYKGAQPGLKRMAFQLETAQDLLRAREWLTELGYQPDWATPQECETLHQGPTLRWPDWVAAISRRAELLTRHLWLRGCSQSNCRNQASKRRRWRSHD